MSEFDKFPELTHAYPIEEWHEAEDAPARQPWERPGLAWLLAGATIGLTALGLLLLACGG